MGDAATTKDATAIGPGPPASDARTSRVWLPSLTFVALQYPCCPEPQPLKVADGERRHWKDDAPGALKMAVRSRVV